MNNPPPLPPASPDENPEGSAPKPTRKQRRKQAFGPSRAEISAQREAEDEKRFGYMVAAEGMSENEKEYRPYLGGSTKGPDDVADEGALALSRAGKPFRGKDLEEHLEEPKPLPQSPEEAEPTDDTPPPTKLNLPFDEEESGDAPAPAAKKPEAQRREPRAAREPKPQPQPRRREPARQPAPSAPAPDTRTSADFLSEAGVTPEQIEAHHARIREEIAAAKEARQRVRQDLARMTGAKSGEKAPEPPPAPPAPEAKRQEVEPPAPEKSPDAPPARGARGDKMNRRERKVTRRSRTWGEAIPGLTGEDEEAAQGFVRALLDAKTFDEAMSVYHHLVRHVPGHLDEEGLRARFGGNVESLKAELRNTLERKGLSLGAKPEVAEKPPAQPKPAEQISTPKKYLPPVPPPTAERVAFEKKLRGFVNAETVSFHQLYQMLQAEEQAFVHTTLTKLDETRETIEALRRGDEGVSLENVTTNGGLRDAVEILLAREATEKAKKDLEKLSGKISADPLLGGRPQRSTPRPAPVPAPGQTPEMAAEAQVGAASTFEELENAIRTHAATIEARFGEGSSEQLLRVLWNLLGDVEKGRGTKRTVGSPADVLPEEFGIRAAFVERVAPAARAISSASAPETGAPDAPQPDEQPAPAQAKRKQPQIKISLGHPRAAAPNQQPVPSPAAPTSWDDLDKTLAATLGAHIAAASGGQKDAPSREAAARAAASEALADALYAEAVPRWRAAFPQLSAAHPDNEGFVLAVATGASSAPAPQPVQPARAQKVTVRQRKTAPQPTVAATTSAPDARSNRPVAHESPEISLRYAETLRREATRAGNFPALFAGVRRALAAVGHEEVLKEQIAIWRDVYPDLAKLPDANLYAAVYGNDLELARRTSLAEAESLAAIAVESMASNVARGVPDAAPLPPFTQAESDAFFADLESRLADADSAPTAGERIERMYDALREQNYTTWRFAGSTGAQIAERMEAVRRQQPGATFAQAHPQLNKILMRRFGSAITAENVERLAAPRAPGTPPPLPGRPAPRYAVPPPLPPIAVPPPLPAGSGGSGKPPRLPPPPSSDGWDPTPDDGPWRRAGKRAGRAVEEMLEEVGEIGLDAYDSAKTVARGVVRATAAGGRALGAGTLAFFAAVGFVSSKAAKATMGERINPGKDNPFAKRPGLFSFLTAPLAWFAGWIDGKKKGDKKDDKRS
jgi:hypothetical protein